ncbi:MAG TPA: YCF48-related protein [Vicinamibacterales bacterium]|nr:YCF48-related protein [Vicinamibacterales bacterium]
MNKDESLDRLLERTSRARDATPALEACLDAETLAAWSDGSLTPAARSAAEAHAADCGRCLAVLAAIAKTTPPPLAPAKPSWLSVRWLVPLATAAVAITAWMVIQTPSTPQPSAPEPALADAAQGNQPEARTQVNAATPAQTGTLEKKRESAANTPRKEQDQSRSNAEIAARPSDVATDRLGGAARRKPEAGSRKPDEGVSAARPAPAAPAATPNAPARADLKDERARQFSAAAAPPVTIGSPDPAVRWRLAGRTVERSGDAGTTWSTQATGTSIDLLAGASPSVNVCWIVGRSGLVLLTTDGTTWRRLEFPDPSADLVGVVARDGLDATVTAANGRRYRTTDAGRNWTLQENPAAPF